jgi:hypothetical protein
MAGTGKDTGELISTAWEQEPQAKNGEQMPLSSCFVDSSLLQPFSIQQGTKVPVMVSVSNKRTINFFTG